MMQKLKMQVKQTYHVDYSDLERFIQDVYNVDDFSIARDQEQGNDTSISMNVVKKPLNTYDSQLIEKFTTVNPPSFMLYTVMQDMCNKDLIPDGQYVIKISW
jgi:hypothetical protein